MRRSHSSRSSRSFLFCGTSFHFQLPLRSVPLAIARGFRPSVGGGPNQPPGGASSSRRFFLAMTTPLTVAVFWDILSGLGLIARHDGTIKENDMSKKNEQAEQEVPVTEEAADQADAPEQTNAADEPETPEEPETPADPDSE